MSDYISADERTTNALLAVISFAIRLAAGVVRAIAVSWLWEFIAVPKGAPSLPWLWCWFGGAMLWALYVGPHFAVRDRDASDRHATSVVVGLLTLALATIVLATSVVLAVLLA